MRTNTKHVIESNYKLDTRKTFYVGCWNIKTMYEASRANQIANEMKRYKIKILGLSEVRWLGSGETRLANGTHILYSGKIDENEKHEYGVAFMLDEESRKALLEWKPISERLITARFKGRFFNISIINAYAPTNNDSQTRKDEFYEQLQKVYNEMEKKYKKDIKLLIGDMNAKIGSDNTGREEIMGKEGIGEVTENGNMFIDFCAFNNLLIGGSIFAHKTIHKVTWISPDGKTKNQIDHITIDRKYRSHLMDVRAMRGAEAASDHILIRAKLKNKLQARNKHQQSKIKYNIPWLMKNTERQEIYAEKLEEKYGKMDDMNSYNIEQLWHHYKEILKEAAEETVGVNKSTNKEWLTEKTWKLIDERRNINLKILGETNIDKNKKLRELHQIKNREVKRSARTDRRLYYEDLLKTAEKAAMQNDMKTVYDINRKISRKKDYQLKQLKNDQGELLKSDNEILNRWKEYFEIIYGQQDPLEQLPINYIEENNTTLEIKTEQITEEEVRIAIQQLKNGKATGTDNLPGELLKIGIETNVKILHCLLNKIWLEERLPKQWLEGRIITLPKKGDKTNCDNWRAITLLNHASKTLSIVILNRIKKAVDEAIRENQAGFRTGRGCIDQIITLRIITEECVMWQKEIFIGFIDFKKAFDRVNRDAMWMILKQYGIPNKIIRMIKILYDNYQAFVQYNGKTSEAIDIKCGVRQGCILSPVLFLLVIDWIMKGIRRNGLQWRLNEQLGDLEFADDVCLITENLNYLQRKIDELRINAGKMGLEINANKTCIMKIKSTDQRNIQIEENVIENVSEFNYLGSVISNKGGCKNDIKRRIGRAQYTFNSMIKIWLTKELSLKTKIRLFNSNVKSILLYGCESWSMNKKERNEIQVLINKCLRRILGIYWPEVISNEELWRRTNQEPIEITIKKRKWNWIGHTLRKPTSNITKQALDYKIMGKRRQGRPITTWKRNTELECKKVKKKWNEVKTAAGNKKEWKEIVNKICAP